MSEPYLRDLAAWLRRDVDPDAPAESVPALLALLAAGNEIDLALIAVPPAGAVNSVPVEAKWVDHGWRSEARTIDGKYNRGILATKSVLGTSGRVWAVPAPLVALLLA